MAVFSSLYFETYDSHLDILLLNNLVFTITSIVKEGGCNKGNVYRDPKVEPFTGWTIDEPRDDRKFTKIVSSVVFGTYPTAPRKK